MSQAGPSTCRRSGRRPAGLPYHRIHEAGLAGWWRPVVGTVMMLLGLLVIGGLVALIPFAVWYAATGADLGASVNRLVDLQHPTPAGLAYLNLALSAMIPLSWAVNRSMHGLLPRWLASVGRASAGASCSPAWGSPSSPSSRP